MACNQWVYTLGNKEIYDYENAIVYDDAYYEPHSNNNEDGLYQSQKQRADYEDSDENGGFVFPE